MLKQSRFQCRWAERRINLSAIRSVNVPARNKSGDVEHLKTALRQQSSSRQRDLCGNAGRSRPGWSCYTAAHYCFVRPAPFKQYFIRDFMCGFRRQREIFTPPPVGGRGIVFGLFLSFFLSLFLCQQHYEKTVGPICMKFSGKVCSDHGTT